MAEKTEASPKEPESPAAGNDDDRRAAAAATNRKRTLEDWEEKKRKWRKMGVPSAMPARK